MRAHNPRHRYDALKAMSVVPETEYERSLYVLLHGREAINKACPHRQWDETTMVDPCVEYPYHIFQVDGVRPILEAFLLASSSDYAVSEALGMPQTEVEIYRALFFDTAVFRTQLERMMFMQQMPDTHPHKHFYSIALRQGLEALRWHYCQDKGEISPEAVLKTVMTDAYFRALEHRGVAATTRQAQEAAKFAKISIECARALLQKSEQIETDIEHLRVKFEEVRKNRTLADLQREMGVDAVIH